SKDFDTVAFNLKPGQVSDPIKVEYGYHIVKVEQKEDGRMKPFEEVKGDILAQFQKQRGSEMMQQISDKAQAALQKDPTHPEKVAADLGVELINADNAGPGDTIPGVGASPDFDNAV